MLKSIGLITLGRKSYLDKLEGIDKDGNNQSTYDIRLKGISPGAIEEHVRIERKTERGKKEDNRKNKEGKLQHNAICIQK